MNRTRLVMVFSVVSLCVLAACDNGGSAQSSPTPSHPSPSASSPSPRATPSTPTDLPENAAVLILNQPNSIAGLQVVAGPIEEGGAQLDGFDGTGGWADIGQSVEISGVMFRVVATWVDPDPSELDGANRSRVWVVVE